jgi:hypothetical protein
MNPRGPQETRAMTSPVNEPSEALANSSRDFDAVIVGAGFSGVYKPSQPARSARAVGPRLRGRRRRRRHVVLQSLPRARCHSDSYV